MKSSSSAVSQPNPLSRSPILAMAEALNLKEQYIMKQVLQKGFQPWEARDIYQEVSRICIEDAPNKHIEVPVAYVLTVAKNLIVDACKERKAKRLREVPLEGEVLLRCQREFDYEDSQPREQQAEQKLRVIQALGLVDELLTPLQAQILRLNIMEGLDLKEISTYLGNISHASVRKQKEAALKKLNNLRPPN